MILVPIARHMSPSTRPARPILAESSDPCGYKQGAPSGAFGIAIDTFPA